jgi:acyl transferase domain-containing protein/acyl carrier protein
MVEVRKDTVSSRQAFVAPVLPSLVMVMKEITRLVLDELDVTAHALDDDFDPDAVLMEDGYLDSYMLPSFASSLAAQFGVNVPATVVLETGTVRALAARLLKLLAREQHSSIPGELSEVEVEPGPIAAVQGFVKAASTLAVVGVSGRWPGSCTSEATACSVAIASADAVGVVPSQRWVPPGSLNEAQSACVKWGGFVSGADSFDAVFFRVSKTEVQAMDPQQRLLLELAYTTLHEGGWRQAELMGSAVGIALGISNTDFGQSYLANSTSVFATTGGSIAVAAGRLSFLFGLHGPCVSVDTACSSALVALHSAALSVRTDDTPGALVEAVNLVLSPQLSCSYARAGMLSADGRCKFLDSRANGYVRGEGSSTALVCPISGIGGAPSACLAGSCVWQDGRSASLTAPNGQAQGAMVLSALSRAGGDIGGLRLVEAHGTGTALGDPTELAALLRNLSKVAKAHEGQIGRACISGVKANFGHLEPAAGLGGCVRALHNLWRGHCAGNAQLRVLNTLIGRSIQGSDAQPVLPTQLALLYGGTAGVMAAGVSSFGFSGTIAHAVLCSTVAGRAEALRVPPPPLTYRRCAFSWHKPPHPLVQRRLTSADGGRSFRPPATCASALSATLALLAPLQRRAHVEASVLRVVRELGGLDSAEVDADTPLMDAGIDSFTGAELPLRLRALMDIELSNTLQFEQPTPRAVAEHLLEWVRGDETTAPPSASVIAATASILSSTPVVLAGAVGLLPGGCDVEAAQIELCRTCGDAIVQVPASRWTLSQAVDVAALTPAQVACTQHGGFVSSAVYFDAGAFHVSPAEASLMDPQQRLLLGHGYRALHSTSHRRSTLGDTGVFLGIDRPDWALIRPPAAQSSLYAMTVDSVSVAAGRLGFLLGLQGPCESIDTACASALVAAHSSVHAVRDAECSDALALAVSLKLAPHNTLNAALAGMLSDDGRCKALDTRANGYTRAEGAGAIVLRPAEDETSSDSAAMHSGSAVRQDGRSASLTAPNGSAQRMLLLQVLGRAALTPDEVELIEAHGTGTPLGDPTEVGAVAAVYGVRSASLTLGAAKASIGHAEVASGQVGMLRLLLSLGARAIAGNAQLRSLNPLVGQHLQRVMMFALPTQGGAAHWSMGGVSAFAYSGTIAHTVFSVLSVGVTSLTRPPQLTYKRHAFPWQRPLSYVSIASSHALPTFHQSLHQIDIQGNIEADTSLMSSGVTSIGATHLSTDLSKVVGIALSPTLVFEHPTPRAIANHFAELAVQEKFANVSILTSIIKQDLAQGQASAPMQNPSTRKSSINTMFGATVDAKLPCSSMQHQLILHQQLQPQSTAYNEPVTVSFDGYLNEPIARSALQVLVRRHAVLRTYFAFDTRANVFYQVILPADAFVVPLSCCSKPAEWSTELERELRSPFDLCAAPPLRAILLQAEPSCLVVNVHHVAADMQAMAIIRTELAATCKALVLHFTLPTFAPTEFEYADFALREHSQRHDEMALQWWMLQLHGVPEVITLPLDRMRPDVQDTKGSRVEIHIDQKRTEHVEAFRRAAGTTLNSALLATWGALLLHLSGQTKLVVGLPHSMR